MTAYDPVSIRKLRALISAAPATATPPTIEELRAGMENRGATNPPARDIRSADEGLAGRPALRIWAEGVSEDRVIYYLPGGGYVAGVPFNQLGMLGELSRFADAQILALDYSKAPERRFPAAFDDTVSGLETIRRLGKPFALAGDSAGGGLVLAALAHSAGAGDVAARAAALFGPWADLSLSLPSIRQLSARDPLVNEATLRRLVATYAPNVDPKDPRLSPVFAEMAGLPPLLIQVGSEEVFLDDALAVDRAARAAGVEVTLEVWPEMIHVWHAFTASLPQATQALQRAGLFLKHQLQA